MSKKSILIIILALSLYITAASWADEADSAWHLQQTVDEFGDITEESSSVASAECYGTFSNTATSSSDLKVIVWYDIEGIGFRLLEYGKTRATYNKNTKKEIHFKVDGVIYEDYLLGVEPNGDLYVVYYQDEYDTIKRFLLQGKDIKTIIYLDDSKYSFTIPADGFAYFAELFDDQAHKELMDLLVKDSYTAYRGDLSDLIQALSYDEEIILSVYNKSCELVDAGKLSDAEYLLSELSIRTNSDNKLYQSIIEKTIDVLLKEGKYDKAISTFELKDDKLPHYEDIINSFYEKATELRKNGQANEADKLFEITEEYKVPEVQYKKALLLIDSKNYQGASSILKDLGNYSDSDDLLLACDYLPLMDQLKDYYNSGELKQALKKEKEIRSKKGSDETLDEFLSEIYKKAIDYEKEGKYTEALLQYSFAGEYSDSNEKVKMIKNKYPLCALVPGDEFSIGSYSAINTVWNVLEVKDNKVLLQTKYLIENLPFNKERTKTIWENSSIREWINNDYYNRAFSEGEKALILTTTNDNKLARDTKDKVFLLNEKEVKKYYHSAGDRISYLEDNIENTWGTKIENHAVAGDWLIRDPGLKLFTSSYIDTTGTIKNHYVDEYTFIRPAMWIDATIEADLLKEYLADTNRSDYKGGAADNAVALYEANVGDYVSFGTYRDEPIVWKVCTKAGNLLTLVSKYAIEKMPFYPSRSDVSWSTSTLRTWLNDTFWNAAFTQQEKDQITTEMSPYGDYVFLLSADDVITYLPTKEERMCFPAKYLGDANNFSDYVTGYWWLRQQGMNSKQIAGVDLDGSIHGTGDYPDKEHYVRPCIVIRAAANSEASEEKNEESSKQIIINNDTVSNVQSALNAAGFDCGTPDGVAGQKTKAAIERYQAEHGLNVTGEIDYELLSSLGL